MRRPVDDRYPVTGDRASHAAYNVGAATDYGTPIGTPVVAPFAGRLSKYVTDAGGLGIILQGAEADFYGQHLWVRLADGDYAEGERIALSGNTGTQTTGPHLHCYVIVHATGERLAMEEYLARTASLDPHPFDPRKDDDDMYLISADGEGTALIGARHFKSLTPDEATAWANLIGPSHQVSRTDFYNLRASAVWGDANYVPASTTPEGSVQLIANAAAEAVKSLT